MAWKRYSLNGEWRLSFVENSKLKNEFKTIAELESSGLKTVNAKVPGNFEIDLQRAGVIEAPFYDINVIKMQKYECMHMFYFRCFDWQGGENAFLHFEGLDTVADVFLNGRLLMSCSNMFIAHEAKAELLQGENELVVHIKPAAIEAGKREVPPSCFALPYNYDSLYLRKAASMFGWDIMPRLVSGGIWRDVFLLEKPAERIEDVFTHTLWAEPKQNRAAQSFHYNLKIEGDDIRKYKIRVHGRCGESEFKGEQNLFFNSGKINFELENCRLWYPKNCGDPFLYETVFELFCGDELLDSKKMKIGIRTIELKRTSVIDEEGTGEFCIIINKKKIFAMGTNWVPMDAMHSRDEQRLKEALPMLNELNCNIVRCWGGNVYEHESFFDFCDENGIMIWQDFAMGCAVYPQNREFCEILEPEIKAVVKKYRNHPSLIIWAGDNECDQAFSWGGLSRDPNNNIITRRLIPDLLREHDFTRPYLPSSPFIDETAYKTKRPTPEDHTWGPRDYFKGSYYKNTLCCFASEVGYHGCPSPESLKKFIAPENLWHWFDEKKGRANDSWLAHAASPELRTDAEYAYRIKLMSEQAVTLFGEEPVSLKDFSRASQISQAEAKKYFIERFRISKWRRTGIIWWNLIDGWPQISDAVVDYYFDKKLAYHYIKSSQQPVCLMFDEQKGNELPLFAVNDSRKNAALSFTIKEAAGEKTLLSGECEVNSDESVCIARIPASAGQRLLLIEWSGTNSGKNHYTEGMPGLSLEKYIKDMKKSHFHDLFI